MKIIPDVLVTSGNNGLGSIEGLAATLMKKFNFSGTLPSDSPLQTQQKKGGKDKKTTKETGKKSYKEPGKDFEMNDDITANIEDLKPFTDEDLNQVPSKKSTPPTGEKQHLADKNNNGKSLPWEKGETKVIQ